LNACLFRKLHSKKTFGWSNVRIVLWHDLMICCPRQNITHVNVGSVSSTHNTDFESICNLTFLLILAYHDNIYIVLTCRIQIYHELASSPSNRLNHGIIKWTLQLAFSKTFFDKVVISSEILIFFCHINWKYLIWHILLDLQKTIRHHNEGIYKNYKHIYYN
jgi:hypothetical protein